MLHFGAIWTCDTFNINCIVYNVYVMVSSSIPYVFKIFSIKMDQNAILPNSFPCDLMYVSE